jgi:hypothetical protein
MCILYSAISYYVDQSECGVQTGLAVSTRHPYLFSAGDDKQVKCWDLEYNKVRLL